MRDIVKFRELFKNNYHIPNYQRPYSWEKEQIERLLLDLEEYRDKYYFGHLFFNKKDEENYNIVDGQQRFTTALIFILSIIWLVDQNPSKYPNIDTKNLIDQYIGNKYKKKLETHIGNDNSFLVALIDLKNPEKPTSLAQEKMLESFNIINLKLREKSGEEIIKIKNTLLNSGISTEVIDDRQLSNQVFIFHNIRGKKLSHLENIKGLLIERICRLEDKDNEDFIKNYIDTPVEKIYQLVHSISSLNFKISEDEIISYFFTLYYGKHPKRGFNFNDFERKLEKEPYNLNMREAIKLFIEKLYHCFMTVNNILETACQDNKIGNILALENSIHTITLLIAIFQSDIKVKDFSRCCKLIEIIFFTKKFIERDVKINYFYWLAQQLSSNKKNTEELISELEKYAVEGFENWELSKTFQDYFSEENVLQKDFYKNVNYKFTKYLFWKYENYLRMKNNDAKNPILLKDFLNPEGDFGSVEHIYAQEPDNGQKLDTHYTNNIGNLLVINLKENFRKSNKPVKEKYEPHLSLLQHHQELQKILEDKEKGLENYDFNWGNTPENMKKVIEVRANRISNFALSYFDINSIDTY